MIGETHTPAETSIAVTGAGLLSPLGDDVAACVDALRSGRCAIEDATEPGDPGVARLLDFEATRYANVRGMRVYARATQLEILVTASTFSHLETLLEYDRGLASLGMQRTNPTLMPLGLPSAPGAATALALGAKAFSITLSDGGASGLAALGLGMRLLAAGRANVCVVAAAATLCEALSRSAARAGMLCQGERFRVFDAAGAGTVLGEASAAIVLESHAHALARGRQPLGFLRSQASTFAAGTDLTPALARACHDALGRAGVAPAELALVSSGANGVPENDQANARALLSVLGGSAGRVAVTALKGNLGESLDTSGILQTIAALCALQQRVAPPIARFERPGVPGLRYLTAAAELDAGVALVTATSASGACSALLLSSADV
jgi:3-oxoacyl-[acyl-carrier-protein] synthase II